MQIVNFTKEWIAQAQALIRSNYLEEQAVVTALPDDVRIPRLDSLTENGLGVAAVEDGKLLGFLGAYGPWKPVFCTADVCGVFSPLHAHAVQKKQRTRLWQRLYQAAAEKWARAGAMSHAIVLHAHDADAKQALYLYGFGVRCMDMIRRMDSIGCAMECTCRELMDSERRQVTHLRRALADHLAQSPCFMQHEPEWLQAWLDKKETARTRVFVVEDNGRIAAYMEAEEDGENYVSDAAGIMNICGAYCLPEYRGTGAAQTLLESLILKFQSEGYAYLGVDCESFNPTAAGFWSKYFEAYTHSVVRRIDENAVR